MSVVFLDICETTVGARNVDITDIRSVVPLADGCLVQLESLGVVKVRQSAEELSKKIIDAARLEQRKRANVYENQTR